MDQTDQLLNYVQKVVEFDHKLRQELFIPADIEWEDALSVISKNEAAFKVWIDAELSGISFLVILGRMSN